jgi:hypothetical protein
MRAVVFLDLDDTLFQTLPKCPPGESISPAARARDGSVLSFMTARQQALLDLLGENATLIPVTARNLAAFRRVQLTFTGLAVLDFGGVVLLPDGSPEPTWDAHVRPRAREAEPELQRLCDLATRLSKEGDLGATVRIVHDFDMPLYLVAKCPRDREAPAERLALLRDRLAPLVDPRRFSLALNDNNLSAVPRFLGKERGVRHVLEHHLGDGPVLTLGAGDGLSDAAFLSLCDYAIVPRASQLARAVWPC